jgi:hypothetical protein
MSIKSRTKQIMAKVLEAQVEAGIAGGCLEKNLDCLDQIGDNTNKIIDLCNQFKV